MAVKLTEQLDLLLTQIEKIYENRVEKDGVEVNWKWNEVDHLYRRNRLGLAHAGIKRLIQFGEKFRHYKGSGKNRIEEGLFLLLYDYLYWTYRDFDEDDSPFPIDRDQVDSISKRYPKLKEKLAAFLDIEAFACDSYRLKKERDSFAGKRRGLSLNLFMEILNYFKSSEGLEFARLSLKKIKIGKSFKPHLIL